MSESSDKPNEMNRRDFVKSSGLLGAGFLAGTIAGVGNNAFAQETSGSAVESGTTSTTQPVITPGSIPMREFGKTGIKVSIIGVGGFHLGTLKDEKESIQLIHEAMDSGINFLDNCWDYHNGVSEERMGKALKGRRDKAFLMTKVCTHGRDGKVAMKQLEDSLRRLQTDNLDLWQIHEVAYHNDPKRHFAAGGAAEALLKAKVQGKVRFIGFTGHKDPSLHQEMLDHDFPFDAVQMPLNPFDGTFHSFEKEILPKLNERGIATIGMKSLGGNGEMIKKGAVTIEEALKYAMSLPVTVTVSGMDSLEVLRQNLKIASNFKPMTAPEMDTLRKRCADAASDGRFELYKTTADFEGNEGRKQHGYPLQKA